MNPDKQLALGIGANTAIFSQLILRPASIEFRLTGVIHKDAVMRPGRAVEFEFLIFPLFTSGHVDLLSDRNSSVWKDADTRFQLVTATQDWQFMCIYHRRGY
jgi:hypothetical protein